MTTRKAGTTTCIALAARPDGSGIVVGAAHCCGAHWDGPSLYATR